MSANFKAGDKVILITELNGGLLQPTVKKGAKGVINSMNIWGTRATIHFPSNGMLWPRATLDNVDVRLLQKRW